MTPTAPEFETAEQFLDVVADPSNQPVYIHCASANRVGGVWAIKRVVQDGWSREAALAEGHAIGLKSPVMIDFVHRFLDARG
jgi:protein tyrosine/serine phosphatase